MSKVIRDYIDYKRLTVKSKEKLNNYKRYVRDTKTEKELIKYINSLDGFSINTINDIKALQKNFIKWKYKDWSSKFPHLDQICRTKKAPAPQTADDMLPLKEVEKLVNGEEDLMWKCYWLVFCYGGCRPTETCKLTWKNIEFEDVGAMVKIFSKKNNKTFFKSVPENVSQHLKAWKKINENDLVFPSPIKKGQPITNKGVYFRLKKLSLKLLGKHVYPYQLRRSIATIKYNEDGLNEDDVASQMGHSKSMKHVYMQLNENQIKARARKIWKTVKYTEKEKEEIKELKNNFNELLEDYRDFQKKVMEKLKSK